MKTALIYVLWFLDMLGFKTIARKGFARFATPQHAPYVVYMGAKELIRSGQKQKAQTLLEETMDTKPTLRCGRLLMHVHIKARDYAQALNVANRLTSAEPNSPWSYFLLGDIQYFFLKDSESAFRAFETALDICQNSRSRVPIRVAYKRLCRLLEEKGRQEELVRYLEEFIELEPSNFHEHEFNVLANALSDQGERAKAKTILLKGIDSNPRSSLLRESWDRLGFNNGGELRITPMKPQNPPKGVSFDAVKTRLLTEADDPVAAIAEYVLDPAPTDVVTLSSCVAAIMEGRMFMEGIVEPGFWARALSRFVDQTDTPFAGMAPMANPSAMQALLEEIGTIRTIAAAIIGAVGKLLGQKGWFYIVAGKDAGQIDDALGCIPPYDYYSIMGPENPSALAYEIASTLGCEAAIVDACDIGVAWAVGYSQGVDPHWLEQAMVSNPAGNQEQQTPIVVVKRKKEYAGSVNRKKEVGF